MAAIEVRDFHQRFPARAGAPPVEAVRGLDLTVQPGQVYALLGPNGAGKTSTLSVLEGYRRPTSGSVRVLGADPWTAGLELRRRVGIVLQDLSVERHLSVREILRHYARFYRDPRPVDEVVELVGLTAKADARARTLSGGQQRRLDLALGILGRLELLFLDEPTTGFDPSARREAWDVVRELCRGGTTVLLTTHYMDEAQALSDRLGVLADGRLVAEGTPETIGGRAQAQVQIRFRLPATGRAPSSAPATAGGTQVVAAPAPDCVLEALPQLDAPVEMTTAGEVRVLVRAEQATRVLHRLTGWALEGDVELAGLVVERQSLEDTYLELTAPNAHAPQQRVSGRPA